MKRKNKIYTKLIQMFAKELEENPEEIDDILCFLKDLLKNECKGNNFSASYPPKEYNSTSSFDDSVIYKITIT